MQGHKSDRRARFERRAMLLTDSETQRDGSEISLQHFGLPAAGTIRSRYVDMYVTYAYAYDTYAYVYDTYAYSHVYVCMLPSECTYQPGCSQLPHSMGLCNFVPSFHHSMGL